MPYGPASGRRAGGFFLSGPVGGSARRVFVQIGDRDPGGATGAHQGALTPDQGVFEVEHVPCLGEQPRSVTSGR